MAGHIKHLHVASREQQPSSARSILSIVDSAINLGDLDLDVGMAVLHEVDRLGTDLARFNGIRDLSITIGDATEDGVRTLSRMLGAMGGTLESVYLILRQHDEVPDWVDDDANAYRDQHRLAAPLARLRWLEISGPPPSLLVAILDAAQAPLNLDLISARTGLVDMTGRPGAAKIRALSASSVKSRQALACLGGLESIDLANGLRRVRVADVLEGLPPSGRQIELGFKNSAVNQAILAFARDPTRSPNLCEVAMYAEHEAEDHDSEGDAQPPVTVAPEVIAASLMAVCEQRGIAFKWKRWNEFYGWGLS